jgi:ketosteroid isomerase-like protein
MRRMAPPEVMRRFIEAVRAGDRGAAFALFADDVVGHVPGRSSMAGERRGREAVMEYIQAAIGHAEELDVEVLDALVGEDHVALLLHERLWRPDRTLDMRRCNVYRVRGEEIAEVWIFESDQYAVDEFMP